jgi:hypothetical protein
VGEPRVTPPRRPSRSWVVPGGSKRGPLSLPGGVTRGSPRQAKAALAAIALALLAGCGESSGVGSGASVTAYVVVPLCKEAERELARHGAKVGEVRVRVSCLPKGERGGKADLAAIGAGARRASEDSTAIAYVTTTDPVAIRFSRTILEEAGIAQLSTSSGAKAMAQLIHAVDEAGNSSDLRASVDDTLE